MSRQQPEEPTLAQRSRDWAFVVAVVLCFGVLGLLWLLLPANRRRQQRRRTGCVVCQRHHRAGRAVVVGLTTLLVVGAGVRIQTDVSPPIRCNGHVSTASGQVWPDQRVDGSAPTWWRDLRGTLIAPTSGIVLAATRAAGMQHCSGPPVVVAFWPPPSATSGGSIVGDVFVTWIPDPGVSGVSAIPGQESYLRFDQDAEGGREEARGIARHESQHVDQWAVATLLGGPLAFPSAYYLDSLFFPLARNHFERAAGLEAGGYDTPDDFAPEPLWLPLGITVGLLLLVMRRPIRWSSRLVAGGRVAGRAHQVNRCPVHSTGWFRAGPRPPGAER